MGFRSKALRAATRYICITRPDSLWKRYLFAFGVIIVMLGTSHYLSVLYIKSAESDAEVINISGRQRMLSQRILFLLHEVEMTGSQRAEESLKSAIALFEESHEWLVNEVNLTEDLKTLYFETGPIPLDSFSRRYAAMAHYALQTSGFEKRNIQRQLVTWGKYDLLGSLNKAVQMFEQQSKANTMRLQTIQFMTLVVAVAIILIEALLIFLPAQISVNRAIKRLERRKRQLVSSFQSIKVRNAELLEARRTLTHAANHDDLTGLANRRAVHDALTHLGDGRDISICVMKVDLDLFKMINDTHGHATGDAVLVEVARALNDQIGKNDVAGRIGGDEFVVIIKCPISIEAIEKLGSDLIDRISALMVIYGEECRIGASIGYTIATTSTATPDQILIESDLALYEAKRNGRGRCCGYSDSLRTQIEARKALFAQINDGLDREQFIPFLQPQVSTASGALTGCEILARWNHPDNGVVPPAIFVAAAEDAGLLPQIDLLMLQMGLDLLERFRAEGVNLPSISVNASPGTLRDPHLPERLLQEIRSRHLQPADLTIEVLESTLIESEDDIAVRTIDRLATEGFSVVLDDFGTGYSSMSTLSHLQLNGIKLDRSLIEPLPELRAQGIISALVTLGQNLNMKIVAEGVETKVQLEEVCTLGCDTVQGYLTGRPMDAEAFLQWYEARQSPPLNLHGNVPRKAASQ